jgi:hypothetical protein
MVQFISRKKAMELVRSEPVVFAEIVSRSVGGPSLEVHVMHPVPHGAYEVERDDTGPVSSENVEQLISRIAAARGCRYATIYPAEENWPPPWAAQE